MSAFFSSEVTETVFANRRILVSHVCFFQLWSHWDSVCKPLHLPSRPPIHTPPHGAFHQNASFPERGRKKNTHTTKRDCISAFQRIRESGIELTPNVTLQMLLSKKKPYIQHVRLSRKKKQNKTKKKIELPCVLSFSPPRPFPSNPSFTLRSILRSILRVLFSALLSSCRWRKKEKVARGKFWGCCIASFLPLTRALSLSLSHSHPGQGIL